MNNSRIIRPSRMRILPKYFSPVPHQLVRDGHLSHLEAPAASLYLFLVCVGDQNGVSYYSDAAIRKRLKVENIQFARQELIHADLVAYEKPLYQILSLPVLRTDDLQHAAVRSTDTASVEAEQLNRTEQLRLKNDFNQHLKQYLSSISGGVA